MRGWRWPVPCADGWRSPSAPSAAGSGPATGPGAGSARTCRAGTAPVAPQPGSWPPAARPCRSPGSAGKTGAAAGAGNASPRRQALKKASGTDGPSPVPLRCWDGREAQNLLAAVTIIDHRLHRAGAHLADALDGLAHAVDVLTGVERAHMLDHAAQFGNQYRVGRRVRIRIDERARPMQAAGRLQRAQRVSGPGNHRRRRTTQSDTHAHHLPTARLRSTVSWAVVPRSIVPLRVAAPPGASLSLQECSHALQLVVQRATKHLVAGQRPAGIAHARCQLPVAHAEIGPAHHPASNL
ncbi:hypothetical protein G6F32_013245 [Rhizopus arrhizus]|nr:hypothetical protein G6F32_013245 [Rhizopus arrhizus]